MPDRLADLLMDADVGTEIRAGVLDMVRRLVDGSGLRTESLAMRAGIPIEHAMAVYGHRNCRLSIRSISKVLELFGMRVDIAVSECPTTSMASLGRMA
jgi:hypothetical protein